MSEPFEIKAWLNAQATQHLDGYEENKKFTTEIWHNFNVEFNRYYFDWELPANEWRIYETNQDNSDFGIWVNLKKHQILTFSLGIITLEIFKTNEHFKKELTEMYVPQPATYVTYSVDENGISKRSIQYMDAKPSALQNEDNREIISINWCIDDVKSVREDLTDEQAIAVLHTFEDRYDCGDDFRVLEFWADYLYPLNECA